jgi:glycosyltransferase involved in cell wall biosynthesis
VHGPVDADRRRFYQAVGADVGLVAISDRQRQLAPELNWLAVVHNALRVRAWPFRRRKQDYVLFLGRFHPEKGAHLAVAAAHAAGLPLVLAGKCADPAEREYFARQVVPRLGPRDRVFGPADAVAKRRLLANARCLLFPVQWEEPFGMVMIEAMACGTPVVALRAGSVPEVVMPGVTGLICDTPDQLPDALHQVTTLDPAACRAHVASRFGADRLGRRYSAVYRRAVTAGPGVPAPVPPAGEPAPAPPVAVGVIRQRLPGHDTDQPRRRPAAVAATSRPELP